MEGENLPASPTVATEAMIYRLPDGALFKEKAEYKRNDREEEIFATTQLTDL